MREIQQVLAGFATAVLRVLLWGLGVVLALCLLAFAVALLLLGALWALLRGRRPRMVMDRRWAQFHRFGTTRNPAASRADDVVDVQVREVVETVERIEPLNRGPQP